MNLPEDVINLLIAAGPVVWLGVSKTARKAAIMVISAAIWIIAPASGVVMYKGRRFRVAANHSHEKIDVYADGRCACDICVAPYTPCASCIISTPTTQWLSRPAKQLRVHYCEMIQIVIASACNHRELPEGFGAEI